MDMFVRLLHPVPACFSSLPAGIAHSYFSQHSSHPQRAYHVPGTCINPISDKARKHED